MSHSEITEKDFEELKASIRELYYWCGVLDTQWELIKNKSPQDITTKDLINLDSQIQSTLMAIIELEDVYYEGDKIRLRKHDGVN